MCFGCSKEPSHQDGSFEYPQHMFWVSNEENSSPYALLSGGLLIHNFYPVNLQHFSCKHLFLVRVENNADPDQMAYCFSL